MSGRKRSSQPAPTSGEEDNYALKRQKNNEAVNRTRQKKRQEESETTMKVEQLRSENIQLEKKVESLEKELSFLKELFFKCANGNRKTQDQQNPGSSCS